MNTFIVMFGLLIIAVFLSKQYEIIQTKKHERKMLFQKLLHEHEIELTKLNVVEERELSDEEIAILNKQELDAKAAADYYQSLGIGG